MENGIGGGSHRGPAGTQGQSITGPAGQDGVRGSFWTTGTGAPSAAANVGDMYLDTATGNVYRMV